jgi:hypothetical protein
MALPPSQLLFAVGKNIPYLLRKFNPIFYEREWLPTTTKMHGDFTYLFDVLGMKAFDHNELIKLINSLVGHHELVELNCLVVLNKLIKLTTSGHNEIIFVGHNKITELTSLIGNNGLIGCFKLFKLSKLIVKYPILIVRINGLDRHTGPNGLIGLVGC